MPINTENHINALMTTNRLPEEDTDVIQALLPGSNQWIPITEALRICDSSQCFDIDLDRTRKSRINSIRHGVKDRNVTRDALKTALDHQKTYGGHIHNILLELGHIQEEDITHGLTAKYGFPYLPLANYQADPEAINMVPEHVCKQYCLVPVDKINNSLMIAMANPLNLSAIEDLEMLTNCNIQIYVSMVSDIKKAINRYYHKVARHMPEA